MANRDKILKIVKKKGQFKAPALAKELGISRQKTTLHLSRLVREGKLEKAGSTRNALYFLSNKKAKKIKLHKIKLVKNIKNLQEDRVYTEVELRLGLKNLSDNVQNIAFYAFTEMLNNAIDHSRGKKVAMEIELDSENLKFQIKDSGIGLFFNVQKTFKLKSEFEALEHIIKGKQTTLPERHSGQGIFFTSRIADIFRIKSHKIEFTRENIDDDVGVGNIRNMRGTEVQFQIKKRSKKILRDLFNEHSADKEEYEFDKTTVRINLVADIKLVARSQAKRLLMSLENFQIINLDFKNVQEVGQGFVDEIFNVFKRRHSHIRIEYINANDAVEFMIKRSLS